MHASLRSIGLAALVVLVSGAVGAGVSALMLSPSTPPSLRRADAIETTPVTLQPFTDEREVDLSITPNPDLVLTFPRSGRVTAWSCRSSEKFISGVSNFAIDGVPVINLSTRVPLWRDLRPGDSGDDVRALQEELNRLGFGVEVDGTLGWASLNAVEELRSRAGAVETDVAEVVAGGILWLPQYEVGIVACERNLGDSAELGAVVAAISSRPATIALSKIPDELIPGLREFRVDSVAVPVDEQGRIVDEGAIASVVGTAAYRAAVAEHNGGTVQISGLLELIDPVQVATVPAGALYDLDGTRGCVSSGSQGRAVQVVGSRLGQTFVTFASGSTLDEVDVRPGKDAPSCR